MCPPPEGPHIGRRPPSLARDAGILSGDVQPGKVVTVLSVSGCEADHSALGHLFRHTKWVLLEAKSRLEGIALLRSRLLPVVICDRSLPDGDWKDILHETANLQYPPKLIVSSRLADDRLWGEVMNGGGYDVLEKPFDHSELVRVVSLAWLAWRDVWQRAAESGRAARAAGDP